MPNPNKEKTTEDKKITIEECINPCAKEIRDASAKHTKVKETQINSAGKSKKKSVKEKPSVQNEECPPGPTCQMARPEITDPKARIDKTKPGCIDFEKCDNEEEPDIEAENTTGCQNYEDCKALEKEEKRRLQEQIHMQKNKEMTHKTIDENLCPKK